MKDWKENLMQEVGRELQIIEQMYERSMEERRSFQLKLNHMRGKVEQPESDVQALKFSVQHLKSKIPTVE